MVDEPTSTTPSAGERLKGLLSLAAVALTVVVLDQASKWLVIQRLEIGGSWPTPPLAGLLSITHVANTGVAFGLFQGRSNTVLVLAGLVVLALVVYHNRLPGHAGRIRLALGLQIGGALGNLTDRVHLGHVTDFVKVGIWPVFNVADSAIFIGVVILSYELLQAERAERAAAEADGAETVEGASLPDTERAEVGSQQSD